MIDFKDEVPHGEPIYHITETVDSLGNRAYRIELATEVEAGTPMNKVLFDSIKDDLTNLENTKLNKSLKATQAQAQAGTDNTNYMTALRVKQAMNVNKITKTDITLSTSTFNTIDLSAYLGTVKTEISMNIKYKTSSTTSITIRGTNIYTVGYSILGNSVDIGEHSSVKEANLVVAIYPSQQMLTVHGRTKYTSGGTDHSDIINETYYYDSLSQIEMGVIASDNVNNPMSIIQYKI